MFSSRIRLVVPRALLCAAAVLGPVMARAEKPPHRLKVTTATDRLSVTGASPGGKVLVVGYELTTRDYAPLYRQVRAAVTAGSDGSAEFRPGRELSPNGFWVAFDLLTGSHGAVAGSRRQLREAELRDEAITGVANGKRDVIVARQELIYTIVIRPGVGVWDGLAGDGAEGDADAALNGSIRVSAGSLKKVAKTVSALADIQRGDVVALFVPHQMGFLVTEVKR